MPTQLSHSVSGLDLIIPPATLRLLLPQSRAGAIPSLPPAPTTPPPSPQSLMDEGTPMLTSWKAANTETRPRRTAPSHRWGGVPVGAWLRVRLRKVSGGGGASPWGTGGDGRRGRAWRVWRNRAAEQEPAGEGAAGVRDRGIPGCAECRGAAGAGRAASPEAEGAEPRSQLPPRRRARQKTPARGRARTARTHSPNNAPRRPAGRLAARRPTARRGERGPEVSPRRFLQIRPLFV